MRQQVYLESRFGYTLPSGAVLWWLNDPITLPNRDHQFNLSVPHASIPLTHWVVSSANNTLHLVYRDSQGTAAPSQISLPQGNYSIDELVDYINIRLLHGFKLTYNDNTNSLHLSTGSLGYEVEVGADTTCAELLGLGVGDTSVLGSYYAPHGVNLAGTASFYLRSNIRTRNRDPRGLGFSNILARVPITKAHNGLEKFSQSGYSFGIWDRSIHYIVIEVLDESMQPVTFHGGSWSLTLEFSVSPAESYAPPVDYHTLIQNESLGSGKNPAADKREDKNSSGPNRTITRNPDDSD